MNKRLELEDRINRVINTDAFSQTLEENDSSVIDFQGEWMKYDSFEKLPRLFQNAIVDGENSLHGMIPSPRTGKLEVWSNGKIIGLQG